MNAKERKRLIGAIETYLPLEYREPILRALRLLAAAEANDGSTPETDENCIQGMFIDAAFSRLFERERNALAARVRELEKDASVSGGVAPVSAEVKTAAGGSPAPNINEAMLLLAEVEPHLDEWNFPITLQDRVTAACNAYFGEVRPFLDAARSK